MLLTFLISWANDTDVFFSVRRPELPSSRFTTILLKNIRYNMLILSELPFVGELNFDSYLSNATNVLPWLVLFFACLSTWRIRTNPKLASVGYVVDRVALGHDFRRTSPFSSLPIIPPMTVTLFHSLPPTQCRLTIWQHRKVKHPSLCLCFSWR
jgi:hypothetical protein